MDTIKQFLDADAKITLARIMYKNRSHQRVVDHKMVDIPFGEDEAVKREYLKDADSVLALLAPIIRTMLADIEMAREENSILKTENDRLKNANK